MKFFVSLGLVVRHQGLVRIISSVKYVPLQFFILALDGYGLSIFPVIHVPFRFVLKACRGFLRLSFTSGCPGYYLRFLLFFVAELFVERLSCMI